MRRLASGLGLVVMASACGGEPAQAPSKRTSVFATIGSAAPKAPPTAPKPVPREDRSLLPRSLLFANPDRAMPLLSHDGKRISYLSDVDGVLNVWVAPLEDLAKARAVTSDKKRGVRRYKWAFTNDHLLYSQDEGGDENWHVHAVI
jgi:hypothetical protein